MGSINTQSVRKEFDKIKSDFQWLVDKNKVSPEVLSVFNALFSLFVIVLAIFLEKNTKKTSSNSGIPPSQTDKDETTPSKDKTRNKDKERNKDANKASNTRTIEEVSLSSVSECSTCKCDLSDVKSQSTERRTIIDIVFEKRVKHVDAEVKICPNCKATTKGKFPKEMAGPLQYGNGIKAYIIQLLVNQMISLKRVADMLKVTIGQAISEATLLSYIMQLYTALEPWETSAKKAILLKPCINSDETSLRVNKKNHWIHIYAASDIILKFLNKKRGKDAIENIGIIPKYDGVVVHDCWASYLAYNNCFHGLCGSHLLRELTFIIEANNYRWAKDMKRLLKVACKVVARQKDKCLSEEGFKRLQRLYRNILARAEKELPAIPEKTDGKRGKIAKSDAHNLFERLRKYECAVLLFAKLTHVPFTNNYAEQGLRMSKVKQKVSGCFRTEKYAKAFCRISSYLQTMELKGINPWIAIEMALSGKIPA